MNTRLLIVSTVVLTEAICLTVGIFVAGYGVNHALVQNISAQALENNQFVATQFTRLTKEMDLRQVTRGSEDWLRLQRAVEDFDLPNAGFICVTHSRTGQILCHPQLPQNPKIARLTPGNTKMPSGDRNDAITSQVTPTSDALGLANFPDGSHLIAARRLPNLNANVMVHQRLSEIERTAEARSRYVYDIGFPLAGVIVAISTLGSWLWLQTYDSGLAKTNASLEHSLDQRNLSLTRTRNAIIFGLAKLAENRDSDTGEHLDRIREYSIVLSRRLKETRDDIDDVFVADIGLASALHDIGKVGIPDAVLLKPGNLTAEERRIINAHPEIGCKCLLSIEKHLGDDKFLKMATEICLTHHEKWDGTGYPLGLSGEKVPLSARIVAVADVYDALTSKRPYKDAMPHDEAHQIIMDGGGTHFDPEIVAAFDSLYEEFQSIRAQFLDDGDNPIVPDVSMALDTAKRLDGTKAVAMP